jgi:GH15 family glucan-1,4-alpha-glucosidase
MPSRIEDYALIGNCESAAMVGRNGSIEAACFAALLGGPENGRWQIAPTAESHVTRHYRDGTLVLETRFETADGAAILIDGMGRRDGGADLARIIRGKRGRVAVRMELVIRCEYGSIIPWVRRLDDGRVTAVAGPDRLTLATPAAVHGENLRTIAPRATRQVGNYPQAFSHVALINTAHNLTRAYGPAQHRAESKETIGHNTDTAERLA